MSTPLPKPKPKKSGHIHWSISVPDDEEEINSYLREHRDEFKSSASAAAREAIRCILAFGKDWREKFYAQNKPIWAGEMERRLTNKLDNLKVVVADNGPASSEDVEIDIGDGLYDEG